MFKLRSDNNFRVSQNDGYLGLVIAARKFFYCLIKSVISLLLVFFVLSSCTSLRRDIDMQKGYQRLFKMEIGGVRQSLLVRGQNTKNPFLLILHGGPGYPFYPDISEEYPYLQLEHLFNVVYWEQRGTGKSFSSRISRKSMNTARFVKDIKEVVDFISDNFHQDKIYLWGHSWGSNIGVKYASLYPETLYAYFGTGQSVNPLRNEKNAYEVMLRNAKMYDDKKMLKDLLEIDTTDYQVRDALKVRDWMYKYGGIEYKIRFKQAYGGKSELNRIVKTPEYSFFDIFNIAKKPYFSGQHLWKDMQKIDLETQVPEVNLPVYFLLGRHDLIVSSEIAAEYFQILEAPEGKTLVWFEESAHRPFAEEPQKFLSVVGQIIKDTHPYFDDYYDNLTLVDVSFDFEFD
ncbi:MAG: alpha/beta hydrolase [Cyclobacteriaceae bacterium]|nr:alpha/beta hydrolase [Cyclobacteriaceae bacterium]